MKNFDEYQEKPLHRNNPVQFSQCPFTSYIFLRKPRIINKPVGATVTHSSNKYLLNYLLGIRPMPDHKEQALNIRFIYVTHLQLGDQSEPSS